VDYKIILIIAQVLGYMLSKFLGIRIIAAMKNRNRFAYLLAMIFSAELFLLLFALTPAPYNTIFMFLNGLPLGLVWGVVFSYLEGRRFTELLGVFLCSSFIVSSGAVKSIGLLVMTQLGVNQFWMPFITGLVFILPFLLFAWMLEKMPPPSASDISLKTERIPMNAAVRKKVLSEFLFPLIIIVGFYTFLTAMRDFRDNFSREIWDAVGFEGNAAIYTYAEVPVAIFVLLLIGLFVLIKDNFKAFMSYHILLLLGAVAVGLGTQLFQMHLISPVAWMILVGFGLYVCYVPFNGLFFDRMIATFRSGGNAGFLIYIADAFGYLGSMAILLYKNFGQSEMSWLRFFINSTYVMSVFGIAVTLFSYFYFRKKYRAKYYISTQKGELAYE
jgi:MFS family permease